jgi:ubiquinone/menaquinone biosynthesis C-methylase UbiE
MEEMGSSRGGVERKGVDYDAVAPTYDERFGESEQPGVAASLTGLAHSLEARRILEVGCGTGHWLRALQPVTRELYGLDFSAGMLAQARRQDAGLRLARGRASRLPYPAESFDLVTCVNALHHFGYQRGFVLEARRILRPGGALAVLGMTPHGHQSKWYVYDYFPGTFEADLARFSSWGTVLDWMTAAGFEAAEWRIVAHIRDDKLGREVLEDPFLQKGSSSQLILLSDEAYAAGLRRIRMALEAAEAAGEALRFPVHIITGMLVGRVP